MSDPPTGSDRGRSQSEGWRAKGLALQVAALVLFNSSRPLGPPPQRRAPSSEEMRVKEAE